MTEDEISKLCAALNSLGERMSHVIPLSMYNNFVAEAGLSETQIRETFARPLLINSARESVYVGAPRFGKTIETERMMRRDQTPAGNVFKLFPPQQKALDSIHSMIDRNQTMFLDYEVRTPFHTLYGSFKTIRDTYIRASPPNWSAHWASEPNAHQKMGKRMRNKVQVPTKETQIVNSNKHTKKKGKRK